MRLLDTTSLGSLLAGSLGGELLARGFSTRRLACRLLFIRDVYSVSDLVLNEE